MTGGWTSENRRSGTFGDGRLPNFSQSSDDADTRRGDVGTVGHIRLDSSTVVTVQAEDSPEELLVTIDGQVGANFGGGETLTVRRGNGSVVIVRFPGGSFFSTLRQKLGWGGLVDRDRPIEARNSG